MSWAPPGPRVQQITATVHFVDIVGFSRLSETEGAEKAYLAVIELLRLLDGLASRSVRAHRSSDGRATGRQFGSSRVIDES